MGERLARQGADRGRILLFVSLRACKKALKPVREQRCSGERTEKVATAALSFGARALVDDFIKAVARPSPSLADIDSRGGN
jgi:hypothetical protein